MPAMISPDTAPRGIRFARSIDRVEEQLLAEHARLARADAREPVRVEELEAEREVIDARPRSAGRSAEILLGRELHADEQADIVLERPHVRRGELAGRATPGTRR